MNDGERPGRTFFQRDDVEIIRTRFGGDQKVRAPVRRHIDARDFGNRRWKRDRGRAVAGFDVEFVNFALRQTEFPKLVDVRDRLGQLPCANGERAAAKQGEREKFILLHSDYSFQFCCSLQVKSETMNG